MKQDKDPFTNEELIERAKKSEEDYAAGRIMTIDELEAELEKW
ncbi:hypothetical protein [Flavobacterium zepuense]|nr:hypothetical protein [Flavobacterium zepuense]